MPRDIYEDDTKVKPEDVPGPMLYQSHEARRNERGEYEMVEQEPVAKEGEDK